MSGMKKKATDILEDYSNSYSQVDLETLTKFLEQIKAEAIKEFWDEMSKKCARTVNISVFSGKPYVSLSIREDIAEEVVKEMAGDTDA